MSTYNYRLITPTEEEEVYPYRRVWQSIVIESGILLGVAIAAYVAFGIFDLQLPALVNQILSIVLALLPVGLWMVFSLWRERFVLQPRARLLTVLVTTALVANGVSIPFIEAVFQTSRWLPVESAVNRIVGYTFTVGIVQEAMKYLVVRYLVWPDQFRTRLDGIAYCAASAIGYATVLNLRVALSGSIQPDVVAVEVFGNVAVNLAASLLIGYGLSEVRFGNASPFLATMTIALAALITGVIIPVRAGLVNSGFSLSGATTTPIYGIALSAGALIGVGVLIAFFFNNAERREREATTSREA